MIERPIAGPDPAQEIDIFLGPGIALVMAEEIAVAPLFDIVAAGDDMDGEPAAGELVEGAS